MNYEGFKVGDKVVKKTGEVFSNGDYVATIEVFSDCKISPHEMLAWFKETGTNMNLGDIEKVEPQRSTIEELNVELEKKTQEVVRLKKELFKAERLRKDIETTINTLKELDINE